MLTFAEKSSKWQPSESSEKIQPTLFKYVTLTVSTQQPPSNRFLSACFYIFTVLLKPGYMTKSVK